MNRRRALRAAPIAALLAVGLVAPAQADVVNGTSGPDVLVGTAGADTIHGYAGKDTLSGKGGDDFLNGGRGTDRVYGGPGADRLYGGRDGYQKRPRFERDLLDGGGGPDRIFPRFFDRVYAGPGNDTIKVVHTRPGSMDPELPIRCGPGNDVVITPEGWPPWFIEPQGCEHFKTYPHPD